MERLRGYSSYRGYADVFLKIKPFFRGYEVTGLRRLQGYEIAKSSIYLATTAAVELQTGGVS